MSSSRFNLQTTHYSLLTSQSGQTLIETIAAVFILTMALSSALGLAVYAFSRSGISQNEIVATNLAREGIDVVRSMRDSNWLAGAISADTSFNLTSCTDVAGTFCYPKATSGPVYNISVAGNKRIIFSSNGSWTLDATADYNLYVQPDGTFGNTANGASNYARMINISFNTSSPYTNQNSNQEMIVKSVVAWRGKNCAIFNTGDNLLTLSTSCKVVTEEHLTNWKDYK